MKFCIGFIVLGLAFLMVWYDLDARLAEQTALLMFARHDVKMMKKRLEKISAGYTILMVPYKVSNDTSWYFVGGLEVMHVKRDSL